jgi:hypothetical protein
LALFCPIQSAFISQALNLDQTLSGSLLEEASGLEADSACVGMNSEVLDHGTLCGSRDRYCPFGTRGCAIVGDNPDNSAGVFPPCIY